MGQIDPDFAVAAAKRRKSSAGVYGERCVRLESVVSVSRMISRWAVLDGVQARQSRCLPGWRAMRASTAGLVGSRWRSEVLGTSEMDLVAGAKWRYSQGLPTGC